MKKILLLGDSIRMSYQPLVEDMLRGKAKVVGPDENCQSSAYTVENIDDWLDDLGKPDVVHWNNGLHDVGHNSQRDPEQLSSRDYSSNLEQILEKLLSTGANVIWATTTPVHPDREGGGQWSWENDEINKYSKAALDVMKKHSVRVNNLHATIASNPNLFLADDGLHLSEEGKKACATAVAREVEKALERQTETEEE